VSTRSPFSQRGPVVSLRFLKPLLRRRLQRAVLPC
jgi:hypothetical protein